MIKNLIRIPIALLILWVLGSYIGSWYLLSPHNQGINMPSELRDRDFESFSYEGSEGNHLSAWQKLHHKENPTVILLHGIKSNKLSLSSRALIYDSLGFNIIMLDSRGHGESESLPISFGWNESKDLISVIENIKNQGFNKIIIHGLSLGAATGFYTLAGRELAQAFISESCYLDLKSAFYNRMPDFPFKEIIYYPLIWFSEIKFGAPINELSPLEKAKNINAPTLFMYGDKEEVLPKNESEQLFYQLGTDKKKKIIFENADHVDFFNHSPDLYKKELSLFLKQHVKSGTVKKRVGKEKRGE